MSVLWSGICGPLLAADAIDLRTVTVHGSPTDVANWPVTVQIQGLAMRPTGANPDGLVFSTSTIPDRWDTHIPGWGAGLSCPADGCILYTVWPVVSVNNSWHTAGIVQMWKGRAATGAPILTDFHRNWAYSQDRWGELYDYQPQVGDQMGFFLTAGNARFGSEYAQVRERSQVVVVSLPAGDSGSFSFVQAQEPQPPIITPPIPSTDLSPILNRLEVVYAQLSAQIKEDGEKTREQMKEFTDKVDSVWKKALPYILAAIGSIVAVKH